jgi:hypothetical protein
MSVLERVRGWLRMRSSQSEGVARAEEKRMDAMSAAAINNADGSGGGLPPGGSVARSDEGRPRK